MKTVCDHHGKSHSPEWNSWNGMKDRCHNPKSKDYSSYGGRGIKVCLRWREDFMAFYKDMGEKPTRQHTLDRIDPNGNYEPSNCRWATKMEQANNRRDNKHFTHNGRTQTLSRWADELGMSRGLLWNRVYLGWSTERILTP